MAGGGDTQIGLEEKAQIDNELNQIKAWNTSMRNHTIDLRTDLQGAVPQKYSTDYPFGKVLCNDIKNFSYDIETLCDQIDFLVATTHQFAEEHLKVNAEI